MSLFVLVHGAWHGAWCWEKVVPELESRGHRTVAMDMPIEHGLVETYIDPVVKVIEGARDGDEVILVGHSMGGLVIPFVAQRTPVAKLVYLCALIPAPGKTLSEFFAHVTDVVPEGVFTTVQPGPYEGTTVWPVEAAKEWFFHDCTDADAEWAAAQLRPQYLAPGNDPEPLDAHTTPAAYILCTEDRVVRPDWSRRHAMDWLGVQPIELEGSHSPFLSRPAPLAEILVGLA